MKKYILFFSIVLAFSCFSNKKQEMKVQENRFFLEKNKKEAQKDTFLFHIQEKILSAENRAFALKDISELSDIEKSLDQAYSKHSYNLILYWKCYVLYWETIFYMENKEDKMSKKNGKIINEMSVSLLEKMKNKTADDYVMLVLHKQLSFYFKSGIQAPFIANEINNLLETAYLMDTSNIRVFYAMGSQDFHTPSMYGGGKKVEQYLTKAISLPDQIFPVNISPSWGRKESYEYLIRYYIGEKNKEKAQQYYKEAIALFPDEYNIYSLKKRIEE